MTSPAFKKLIALVFFAYILCYSFNGFTQNIESGFENEYRQLISCKQKGIKKKYIKSFAEDVIRAKNDLFSSGYVIDAKSDIGIYLYKIYQKVAPESLLKQKEILVYPYLDDSYNAFTIYDGNIFFNIGLFADVLNEAEIAIIIGHEIGHTLNEDVKNSYINSLKAYTRKKKNKELTISIANAHLNRTHELIADSIGYELACKAGYNLNNAISMFSLLNEYTLIENKKLGVSRLSEINQRTVSSKPLGELLASHPEIEDRVLLLNAFDTKLQTLKTKNYIVANESEFRILQAKARLLKLEHLFNSIDYYECLKQAFIYHLQSPENTSYIYYCLEALRKLLILNPNLKSSGFLMSDITDGSIDKSKSILNNLDYLFQVKSKKESINPLFLKPNYKIPFETNEQAVFHFSELAKKNNDTESLFVLALLQTKEIVKKELLSEYISRNGNHTQIANLIAQNKLNNDISNFSNNVVLIKHPNYYYKYQFGLMRRLFKSNAVLQNLKKKDSFKSSNVTAVYKEIGNAKNYKSLSHILNASMLIEDKKGFNVESIYSDSVVKDKKDFFEVFPELYCAAKENNLKSISETTINIYDDRTQINQVILNSLILMPIYVPFKLLIRIFHSDRFSYSINMNIYRLALKNHTFYSKTKHRRISTIRIERHLRKAI